VIRFLVLAFAAIFRPRALLITENLCLRQQLLVLQRRHPRPRLSNADRRFWILASRWLGGWRNSLLIVKPETVLSLAATGLEGLLDAAIFSPGEGRSPGDRGGLQALIRRMSTENPLWAKNGSKPSWQGWGSRFPPEPWRSICVSGVPKAPRTGHWACDFFCVRTVLFQTLHVFFVVRHANREILHAEVTRHPTAAWAAQQIVECCAWDRASPRFLIHDRDSRYGASFDRRVRHLGIRQVRTPFRSPRANAVAERWVRSVRWHGP
jgi:putative transposase